MPEQPYYSHTDSKGDTLEIRKSPNTQPEYGAPEVRVTPSRSSGYREWWYGPRGEEAIEAARVFLDAAGLTDHVIVAPADDGTTGHRVVSEEWLTTVIKINREDAARSMRERATEEIQRAWPALADSRTPVEQCGQVVDAVDALSLLADDSDAAPADGTTLTVPDSPLESEIEGQDPDLAIQRAEWAADAEDAGDVHYDLAWNPTGSEGDLTLCESTFVGTTGAEHACAQPQGHTTMHRNIAGTACWHNYEAGGPAAEADLAARVAALEGPEHAKVELAISSVRSRVAHLERTRADEAHALATTLRGIVDGALKRVADLESAPEEAVGLMAAYQTDQAAIRGRLDALEAQPKNAVHITVTGPALTEETNG